MEWSVLGLGTNNVLGHVPVRLVEYPYSFYLYQGEV